MTEAKKANKKTLLYTTIIPRSGEILRLLDEGQSEANIAKYLGISYSSWRKNKKALYEWLDENRKEESSEITEDMLKDVEKAMYEAAIGGTKTIRKAMKVKTIEYTKDGKRLREVEKIQYYSEDLYIPPSVSAGQFLLKNLSDTRYSNNPAELDLKEKEFEHKKEKDW